MSSAKNSLPVHCGGSCVPGPGWGLAGSQVPGCDFPMLCRGLVLMLAGLRFGVEHVAQMGRGSCCGRSPGGCPTSFPHVPLVAELSGSFVWDPGVPSPRQSSGVLQPARGLQPSTYPWVGWKVAFISLAVPGGVFWGVWGVPCCAAEPWHRR